MNAEGPLLPPRVDAARVTLENSTTASASVLTTLDHAVIRIWAAERQAQPATGEETESGPSSDLRVVDGGTGLRFNFPGNAPFRPIAWDEWLGHFDRHDLLFVFDNERAGERRPASARAPSNRYRLVKARDWDGVA